MQDVLHNPQKRAPEHVQLVKNLTSCEYNHSTHADETHLPKDSEVWEKLESHIDGVAQPLKRVCFQCGMRNYPQPGDTECHQRQQEETLPCLPRIQVLHQRAGQR